MTKREMNLKIAVAFLLPLTLYWLGGGDLTQRSETLAWTFFWSIACALVVRFLLKK